MGLNVKLRSLLLIYFNRIVYNTVHEFYIVGLKMTILDCNILQK